MIRIDDKWLCKVTREDFAVKVAGKMKPGVSCAFNRTLVWKVPGIVTEWPKAIDCSSMG